jgi:ribosomal protein S18 acetylase RimI-like enzyme
LSVLVIRSFETSDAPAVWDLHNVALNAATAHGGNGPWDADLSDVERHYLQKGDSFLVGVLDDRLVAMGALTVLGEKAGRIVRMRVDPSVQRRGYGRQLLHELESRARVRAITTLSLDTTTVQVAAIALYQSEGFVEFDRSRAGRFTTIEFRKSLVSDET